MEEEEKKKLIEKVGNSTCSILVTFHTHCSIVRTVELKKSELPIGSETLSCIRDFYNNSGSLISARVHIVQRIGAVDSPENMKA